MVSLWPPRDSHVCWVGHSNKQRRQPTHRHAAVNADLDMAGRVTACANSGQLLALQGPFALRDRLSGRHRSTALKPCITAIAYGENPLDDTVLLPADVHRHAVFDAN